MIAQPQPIYIDRQVYRGDTRTWTHVLEQKVVTTDDAGSTVVTWEPLDLTDHTWLSQWRASADVDAEVLATSTIDTAQAPQGVIVERLTAAESAKLVQGRAYWDLQSTVDGELGTTTWRYSEVTVRGDASRA